LRPKNISTKPKVFFAPALLLRKRNTHSLTALYTNIIKSISNAGVDFDIPILNDLLGLSENQNNFDFVNTDKVDSNNSNDTIYFPKEFNDEQIAIVEKTYRHNKVLVQGPPGTGKSHTIANLICHLLANGQKILVTAYTKRALEVLKDKLPDEFKNLTVNLLSSDSIAIQDLEASVNKINEQLSNTDINILKTEILSLEVELFETRKKLAENKNSLLITSEKATRSLIINNFYKGTLLELAEKIENEKHNFTWFHDEYFEIENTNITNDLKKFISLNDKYSNIDCNIYNFKIPKKETLITSSKLIQYINLINKIKLQKEQNQLSEIISCNDFSVLQNLLDKLFESLNQLETNTLPFRKILINDFWQNQTSHWNSKINESKQILESFNANKLIEYDKNYEIQFPTELSLKQLKNDAQVLLEYLKQGKSLSGTLFNFSKSFLNKEIKEKLYFINAVKVNGSPCDTIAEFEIVLNEIIYKQEFNRLYDIWNIEQNGLNKNYFDKFQYFNQILANVQYLNKTLQSSKELILQIEKLSSIKIKSYESKHITYLINNVNFNILLNNCNFLEQEINNSKLYLAQSELHPICKNIHNALSELDINFYEKKLNEIDSLNLAKQEYDNYTVIKDKLSQILPNLITEIQNKCFDYSNLEFIESAIFYQHALFHLKKYLATDYQSNLTFELSNIEKSEKLQIVNLASKKAWLKVLENLNLNPLLRSHLAAWVMAVKKIGKTGKGKRAMKFRKEAQIQMEKCKSSVPCWIMPLYKVAETAFPEKGMYDYVIIDEASQLGPDAIFLLYIAKKIIIVGDDKQTSPEYVGIDSNSMTPFIQRYLHDIPFSNFYGIEFSFFDIAKLFCQGTIILREHFRCMPEIIEFSNKHFYAADGKGLYPLKQYSENRLDPLKTVYCSNGFTEGQTSSIINKIEAEAIAEKIKELIADSKYNAKTFGVIALQGTKQSSLIESLLLKKIGESEFHKRNIICGNSASFQGDERDIIVLSLVSATNHDRAALVRPEDERRFNVAASRAKEQIWLFHSILLDDLSNTNDLRYKLLNHFLNYKPTPILKPERIIRTIGNQPNPFESWFEVDVYNNIVEKGYNVIPQYEVAKGKYRIDLVCILNNGKKIAIECDGDIWHGAEQFQNDMMRQRVLERCGWQFVRIQGAEYYTNREKTMQTLWNVLEINDSKPSLPIINISHTTTNEPSVDEKNDQVENFQIEPSIYKITEDNKLFLHNEFLIFTNFYNVYKLFNKKYSTISEILEVNKKDLELNELPIFIAGTTDYSGFMFFTFENGKGAKIPLKSYETQQNRKKLLNAYSNASLLIFIEKFEEEIDLFAISSTNRVVLFNTSQINPISSRIGNGVQLLKIQSDNKLKKIVTIDMIECANPEYYRRNIPASGAFLLYPDKFLD